ncbi:MAG: DUF4345 family protein [Chromatiales bacterium]|nr:DUF4345 family protein [Chromatiales bacterium]
MTNARLWFGRLALAYAALVCTFLGYVYFVMPTTGLAPFGVTLSGEPHSVTFIRTGIGAFFVSQWIVALWGLARPGALRPALGFLVLVNSCVVAGRLLGLVLDGSSPMQWSEVRTEGLSWLLFVAALVAVPRTRPGQPPDALP